MNLTPEELREVEALRKAGQTVSDAIRAVLRAREKPSLQRATAGVATIGAKGMGS